MGFAIVFTLLGTFLTTFMAVVALRSAKGNEAAGMTIFLSGCLPAVVATIMIAFISYDAIDDDPSVGMFVFFSWMSAPFYGVLYFVAGIAGAALGLKIRLPK